MAKSSLVIGRTEKGNMGCQTQDQVDKWNAGYAHIAGLEWVPVAYVRRTTEKTQRFPGGPVATVHVADNGDRWLVFRDKSAWKQA